MNIVYGIPIIIALVCALFVVRRVARQHRQLRSTGLRKTKNKEPPHSQRSEMRADDEMERTQSGSPRFTSGGNVVPPDIRTRTHPRDKD